MTCSDVRELKEARARIVELELERDELSSEVAENELRIKSFIHDRTISSQHIEKIQNQREELTAHCEFLGDGIIVLYREHMTSKNHKEALGALVDLGLLTLLYDRTEEGKGNLKQSLAEIQAKAIEEFMSQLKILFNHSIKAPTQVFGKHYTKQLRAKADKGNQEKTKRNYPERKCPFDVGLNNECLLGLDNK